MPQTDPNIPPILCRPKIRSIRVAGEEAQEFLQALLTNDIDALPAGMPQYTALCNIKGRVIATFMLWRDENGDYLCLTDAGLAEAIARRLKMYVLRRKILIEVEDLEWLGAVDFDGSGLATADRAIPWPGVRPRCLLAADGPAAVVWRQHDETPIADDGNAWDLVDIESGLVRIDENHTEEHLPQHLNMDLCDGVSFSKGCYPGQEVVSRLHYRGTSKQRCRRYAVPSAAVLVTGQELKSAEGGRIGRVVMLAPEGPDRVQLLASVYRNAFETEAIVEFEGERFVFEALALPYSEPN